MTEKTAIIKLYLKGKCLGKVQGDKGVVFDAQGNLVYKHTTMLKMDVMMMINEDRERCGLQPYPPSYVRQTQMLIVYV